MSAPKVTIIIPCYNYAQYLVHTLEVLLKQSYKDWECIVVDDGSEDNTAAVVFSMKKRDSRFKYIYQENRGQAAARNNGLLCAKGKYIQFLDSDDFLENKKLENHVNFLESHQKVDVVYGKVRYFESENPNVLLYHRWSGEEKTWMPLLSGRGEVVVEAFIKQNIMELGCPMFRKSLLNEVGYFDEQIQGVEDWDLCARIALKNKCFQYLNAPETNVLMRLHSSSFSKQSKRMRKALLIFRTKLDKVLRGNPVMISLNKKCLVSDMGKVAFNKLYHGKVAEGLKDVYLNIIETRILYANVKLASYWLFASLFKKILEKK